MGSRYTWALAAPFVLAIVLLAASVPTPAAAQSQAQAAASCPAPEAITGVEVCVDREGGLAFQGEVIMICVTVNIPQIAIFPPPPAPLVHVTNSVNGDLPRVLFEEHMSSGQRCVQPVIGPPFGVEVIRADVIGQDGRLIASDTATFTSAPRADAQPGPQPAGGFPALSLSYDDAQGPGAATITPQGPDEATGGTAITLTIAQSGGQYTGAGFVRQVDARGYLIAAGLSGAHGDSYFLSGTLARDDAGVRWRGRGRWWAVGNPAVTGEWRMAEWPVVAPPSRPQLATSVRLDSTEGSAVSGVVGLVALPEGETRFELQLSGLVPGRSYGLQLHAGAPGQPSASVTQVATVTADASGRASASGLVHFRGTEDIALLDIADGNHFLQVVGLGQTVAVGAIPALQPLG